MGVHTRSTWSNWIWFAGTILIITGFFTVIEGIVALFRNEYYIVGSNGLLVFDMTAWGWIHLIVGACAIVVGLALFTGAAWARVVAVILVSFNAISQLAFLAAYPIWTTIIIALDVLVIWAVVVHGEVVQDEETRIDEQR
ncbi:vacuolar-type H+-ATPase subunit I/STV1 [Kibdelosporangium banguiense]|uniref:Vacuolar-type H+-ATPase subunit I/STV1 n=1 Tax=Kibdelosporangium banguiense TaxID=1365924 RepID=A0ABS4TGN5_9PSEU|nr:hypothetical protein [Kibdelosporangium banguiense]MBP2323496.1 vacuolar-type H+-ATPase subunit I/STV1 [Kibdelosporangium banguiense]